MKIIAVADARPISMMIAPLMRAIQSFRRLVHVGRHYDCR